MVCRCCETSVEVSQLLRFGFIGLFIDYYALRTFRNCANCSRMISLAKGGGVGVMPLS
jgi:hypothetical protein